MLTTDILENILATIPQRTIGVLGDLFVDRYLDLDPDLTEPSLETELEAYQVIRVCAACPGAAGTVISNLVALGVGRVVPISMIGDDGEGYELRRALQELRGVELAHVAITASRRTPTYTKPMLGPRELNRLDIKNRDPMPAEVEERILASLSAAWRDFEVLLVLDQVAEPDCGVVTARVRDRLADLADKDANKIVLVDSRARIGQFKNAWLKPNERECVTAAGCGDLREAVLQMANNSNRPVVCTYGEKGMLVANSGRLEEAPAFAVAGPIDTVGAGDASSVGIACALATGATLTEAAALGNLVASITIQQIGVTGTASPDMVRRRWREVNG